MVRTPTLRLAVCRSVGCELRSGSHMVTTFVVMPAVVYRSIKAGPGR